LPPNLNRNEKGTSGFNSVSFMAPSSRLITFDPVLFNVAKLTLDPINRRFIAGILAGIVTTELY